MERKHFSRVGRIYHYRMIRRNGLKKEIGGSHIMHFFNKNKPYKNMTDRKKLEYSKN